MKFLRTAILWFLTASFVIALPIFPKQNSTRVVDEAGLFSPMQAKELNSILKQEENNSSNQVIVVTVNALEGYDIETYALELGRAWGIGDKDRDNGVILLIAPNERKVRIEVGYGLEGALTDARAKRIISQTLLPAFKQGRFYEGTLRATYAILHSIKGEYTPIQKELTPSNYSELLPFFTILVLMLLSNIVRLLKDDSKEGKQRLFGASVMGSVMGIFGYFISGIALAGILFVIGFIIVLLIGRSGSSDVWMDGGSWGRSSGGFGGGFSGGGGSFGGGGASGSW